MTTMRLFASHCLQFDVVPWKQVESDPPLTPTERTNFAGFTGYKVPRDTPLIRHSPTHIFMRHEDMAICLYAYERSFA